MTITTTIAAVRTRLQTITSPQALAKVYADPKEATSLGEFPACIIALAPGVTHVWGTEAAGGGTGLAIHNYTLTLYLFVGTRETPINELHSRLLPWPQAIFESLVADIKLSGQVVQMGDGKSEMFLTYQAGPMDWGGLKLFGLKILLPIVEKPIVTMN